MHELSIARAIADAAAARAGGRRVVAVDLKVGHLRQVVPDSLRFAFELVVRGTRLEGAELRIVDVPPGGRCRVCGEQSAPRGFPLRCDACESLDFELTAGEELLIEALEVEEEEARSCTA